MRNNSTNSDSGAARNGESVFGWTALSAGAVLALGLCTFFGNKIVGAKEPVEVTLRSNAPATVAALAALGAADEKGTGTFKGVVTFKGKPPARKVVVTKGDATVKPEDRAICAAEEHFSDELMVNEKADNGVANVFVYLRKAPDGYKAPKVPDEPVVFDQKDCHFIPHALIVRCNQKVLIKSDDNLVHNTHTNPVVNTKGFNQAIKPKDREGVAITYEKPERLPVRVQCDFHKWMSAWHLPLDHPFMAVTDADGKFEIKGLPPGSYVFTVWHEMPGYLNNKLAVDIKADQVKEEKLSFTAAQFKVGN